MEILANIFIPLLAAFVGALLGIWYSVFQTDRQEKAILVMLIQEFKLLLNRSTMYYHQYVHNRFSISTLFEFSDPSTFIKLSEVTGNTRVVEAALRLRADFFQVVRYAHRASEAAAEHRIKESIGIKEEMPESAIAAQTAQHMSLLFFVGDLESDGEFYRRKYGRYFDNLFFLLDHLQNLNMKLDIIFLAKIFPRLKNEKNSITQFVRQNRENLQAKRKDLDSLREIEKLRLEKQKLEGQFIT